VELIGLFLYLIVIAIIAIIGFFIAAIVGPKEWDSFE